MDEGFGRWREGQVTGAPFKEGQIKNLKVHDHHDGGSTPSQ